MSSPPDVDRRDALLRAIPDVAKRFLLVDDFDEALREVFERFGLAAGAGRAYLFRNREAPDRSLVYDLVHDWGAPGVENDEAPDWQGGRVDWNPAWRERMEAGEAVGFATADVEDERLRALLVRDGTTAFLDAPVFVSGRWWGFVGFEQVDGPLPWQPYEFDAARALGDVIGAALTRLGTEARLRTAQSVQAAAFESTADGLLVVDLEGRMTAWNQRFLHLWGLPEALARSRDDDRAIGFVLDQLSDPDEFVAKVRALYADPMAESFDVLRRKDGRTFERYSRPQVVGGEVAGRVWSFRDTTDREMAKRALEESESRFRQTFAEAPIGMAIGTPLDSPESGWGITDANGTLCAMLGRSVARLRRLGVWGVIHPADHDAVAALGEEISAHPGDAQRFEVRMLRRDGTTAWAEVSTALVSPAHGGAPYPIHQIQDVTDRRAAADRLSYLAYHDDLTGLPNRTQLQQDLRAAVARARRAGRAVALLNLDVDRFKLVNDALGHAAGDEALRQIAGRLRGAVRDGEIVARHAGDEALVLLPDLEPRGAVDAARQVARRIQEALRTPFVLSGTEFLLDASIGVSVFPRDAEDEETLLRHADAGMYAAKRSGPGNIRIYEAGGGDPAARLSMSSRLSRALENDGLVVHFQPVVRLSEWAAGLPPSAWIEGAEALVRWRTDEGRLLGPDEFIPIAEETGLIDPLTDHVIATAAAALRTWLAAGHHVTAGINLSPVQLRDATLAARLASAVRAAGGDPQAFVVEVTETSAMSGGQERVVLPALREHGMRVAIDDFGTGYSSLDRLLDTRADFLKVDRSIVGRVPRDRAARTVLEAAIRMAGGFGIEPIAEGIETRAQAELVARLGCDLGQGRLFAPPLPAAELLELLGDPVPHPAA